jgi:DNA-binding transcriptional MerR regulator
VLLTMRPGELASVTGVPRETLRYYERRGLLPEPARSLGGHRVYDEDAVTRLRVIKAAQRLGFTLEEISELLRLGRRRGRDAGLQRRAQAKLDEVEARLADLATIRDNLVAAIAMGCDDLAVCVASECCAEGVSSAGAPRTAACCSP